MRKIITDFPLDFFKILDIFGSNMTEVRKLTPIDAATQIRNKIRLNIPGTGLKIPMTPEVAACFFGLPKEFFNKNFSGLLSPEKQGKKEVIFLIADSETIALTALRNWQLETDKTVNQKFTFAAYQSLYRLGQAIQKEHGQQEVKGVTGLFLKLIEETDSSLNIKKTLEEKGALDDPSDLEVLQLKLWELWQALPPEEQRTHQNMNPQNLFQF